MMDLDDLVVAMAISAKMPMYAQSSYLGRLGKQKLETGEGGGPGQRWGDSESMDGRR